MDFEHSPKVIEARDRLRAFMDAHVYPREAEHDDFVNDPANLWQQPPMIEELKALADLGMMGVNLPAAYGGAEAGVISYSLAMSEVAKKAGLDWDATGAQMKQQGRLHLETY